MVMGSKGMLRKRTRELSVLRKKILVHLPRMTMQLLFRSKSDERKAQEEEFETFELKIVHRKNRFRAGFEEDKNFHVVLNSVIAGHYHVTEYLGSAAFSKAVQAHDLHTALDVCVKIIKHNKDFFDQGLDEIKLLKYVNKHDPGDKYHPSFSDIV